MARLCRGPESPYGCGHHDQHVAAAKLGWRRRLLGTSAPALASENERRWLSKIAGDVQHAHTHPEHPNVIAFKSEGRWYELPRAEFRRLVHVGHDIERDEQREARTRAREERRAARAHESEQKRAQRLQRQEERYQEHQRRQVRAVARAERAEVVKIIKGAGGIAPYRPEAGTGKVHERDEYLTLPADVRRNTGRYNMDTAASAINAEMPWLHIEGPNDLVQYFERARLKTTRERYNAKARRTYEAA